ncbi:tripartite tricarboxylate transporter TctB family protein [Pyramidobacter piscolens]|uniref:tripartite tricarboxylate transporter TctB family protein n=1 Tax=Pyramidobacter piscolens TaxID=638849 RepID=UPI0026DEB638|nr:tripartite tricarboxylate transporter TctB family protein [Pyramidobacter piscolens]
MSRRNFYSSLAILAFFIVFYAFSQGLSVEGGYWPELVCVLGGALSALNALIECIQMRREGRSLPLFPLSVLQLKRSLTVVTVIALWLAAVSVIGYLLSSLAATLALVLIFEPQRDKKCLIRDVVVTIVFSVAIYKLFGVLEVYFPDSLFF